MVGPTRRLPQQGGSSNSSLYYKCVHRTRLLKTAWSGLDVADEINITSATFHAARYEQRVGTCRNSTTVHSRSRDWWFPGTIPLPREGVGCIQGSRRFCLPTAPRPQLPAGGRRTGEGLVRAVMCVGKLSSLSPSHRQLVRPLAHTLISSIGDFFFSVPAHLHPAITRLTATIPIALSARNAICPSRLHSTPNAAYGAGGHGF